MPVFENTGIETRRVYKNLDWYRHGHTLADTSAAYIEAATSLCARAGRAALEKSNLDPREIDRIIYVNTTGLATPSIVGDGCQDSARENERVARACVWVIGSCV